MKMETIRQRVASDILTQFMICKTYEEFEDKWMWLFSYYNLAIDLYTNRPCSQYDFEKSKDKYIKETMKNLFGHPVDEERKTYSYKDLFSEE